MRILVFVFVLFSFFSKAQSFELEVLNTDGSRVYQIELINYLYKESGITKFVYGGGTKSTESIGNSIAAVSDKSGGVIYPAMYINGATGGIDTIGINFDFVSKIYPEGNGARVIMEGNSFNIITQTSYQDIVNALIVQNESGSGNQILTSPSSTIVLVADDSLNYTIDVNTLVLADSLLSSPSFIDSLASDILCAEGFVDELNQDHVSVDSFIVVQEEGQIGLLAVSASCDIDVKNYTYKLNFSFLADSLANDSDFVTALSLNPEFQTDLTSLNDSISVFSVIINDHESRISSLESLPVDSDATNEIQDLSLSGNTLSLTDDPTSVDLSPYLDNTDTQLNEAQVDAFVSDNGYLTAESDATALNALQDSSAAIRGDFPIDTDTQLNEAQVDAFVSNNGYLTSEVDGSTTNEIQDLSLSGNTLSLTDDPTPVDLSPYLDNTDTQLSETQVDAFVANNGYLTTEADATALNALQDSSAAIRGDFPIDTDTQLSESQVDAFVANNGYLTSEADGSTTNEIQDLSLSGNILSLTDDPTPVDLSPYLDNTDTQLNESQVDAFVSNNGYLTTESQDLSLSGNILSLTGDPTSVDLSSLSSANGILSASNNQDSVRMTILNSLDDFEWKLNDGDTWRIDKLNNGGFKNYIESANTTLEFVINEDQPTERGIFFRSTDALMAIKTAKSSTTNVEDEILTGTIYNPSNGRTVLDFTSPNDLRVTDPTTDSEEGLSTVLANIESSSTDKDSLNEIQDLSLSGNILSLTDDPTSVDLSPYLDNTDTQLNESQVDAFVSNNGYLTSEADGSTTNEIQDLTLTGNTLSLTDDPTSVDLSSLSLPNGIFSASNESGVVGVNNISSGDFNWAVSNPAEWRISKTNTTSDINSLVFTNSTMTFFVNEGEANEAGLFLGSASGIIGVKTPASILENATDKVLTGIGWNPSNKRTQVDFVEPNNLQVNNPANSNAEEGLFSTLQDIYDSGLDNTDAQIIGGSYDSGTKDLTLSLTNSSPVTIPLDDLAGGGSVTTEDVQDIVGAMLSGNTETAITVTYQDTDGTIDFVVTSGGSTDTSANGITYVSGRLRIINGACHWISAKGNPQGVYDAPKGSLFTDSDGYIYFKKSDGVNGWKAIAISL